MIIYNYRAFLNGKLDLTEAEAVADLIDAHTQAQRRQALEQMEVAFNSSCSSWLFIIDSLIFIVIVIILWHE